MALAPQIANPGSRGQNARYDISGLRWDESRDAYTDGQYFYDTNSLSLDRPDSFIQGLPAVDDDSTQFPDLGSEAYFSPEARAWFKRLMSYPEELPPEFRSYIEQVASTHGRFQAGQIENLAVWREYTPVITGSTGNPTLGTGATQAGRCTRIGGLVIVQAHVIAGSDFVNGSGTVECTIPVAPREATSSFPLGSCGFHDASTAVSYIGQALYLSSIEVRFRLHGINLATYASPFTWAANDELHFVLTYQADN